MSISNATENALMLLIFNATAWANYADNAASSPQTNIHVGLNTGDPGDTGTMSTSETAYGSYARVNVARSGSGWTITNNSASPASAISFAAGSSGGDTVSHFCTGKTGGGTAAILFSGTVSPNIATGSGITPQLTTATTITID